MYLPLAATATQYAPPDTTLPFQLWPLALSEVEEGGISHGYSVYICHSEFDIRSNGLTGFGARCERQDLTHRHPLPSAIVHLCFYGLFNF